MAYDAHEDIAGSKRRHGIRSYRTLISTPLRRSAASILPVNIAELQLPRLLRLASITRLVHPRLQVRILRLPVDAFIFFGVNNALV